MSPVFYETSPRFYEKRPLSCEKSPIFYGYILSTTATAAFGDAVVDNLW